MTCIGKEMNNLQYTYKFKKGKYLKLLGMYNRELK